MCFKLAGRAAISLLTAMALLVPAAHGSPLWTDSSGANLPVQAFPDFVALAAKLSPAVVNISTEQRRAGADALFSPETEPFGRSGEPFGDDGLANPQSLGSGFIINKAGYIVTNAHVIEGSHRILVTLKDGRQFPARLIGRDAKTDIALIKIYANGDLPIAPLGDSDQVQVGQWVMAIGNPFGFDHSVTAGIVSAKGRFIPGNYDAFIQTDASINPGNSGGPLINLAGAVVGVNSAIYTRSGASMGIGFAIPVNLVKEELPQLSAYGKVIRGWLGIYIQQVSAELARRARMAQPHGALVTEVLADSPAAGAGLRRGDIIVEFNHQRVGDSQELPLLVGTVPVGRTVPIKILREGLVIELPITVVRSDEEKLARASLQQEAIGLQLEELTPGLRQELNLGDSNGLFVAAIRPGSAAEASGLQVHDIILEVNRKPVAHLSAYARALRTGVHGKIDLLLVKRGKGTLFIPLKQYE
jgi:serine protease Do